MKAKAQFFKLNYDFSPEFAAAHHDGKETENNRLYDWEDELKVTTDIHDITVSEDEVYLLQGERDGKEFAEEVPNMIFFNFIGKYEQTTVMACSKVLVKNYEIENGEGEIRLKVYLEELEPLSNPVPGIYIAISDFPKSLI